MSRVELLFSSAIDELGVFCAQLQADPAQHLHYTFSGPRDHSILFYSAVFGCLFVLWTLTFQLVTALRLNRSWLLSCHAASRAVAAFHGGMVAYWCFQEVL